MTDDYIPDSEKIIDFSRLFVPPEYMGRAPDTEPPVKGVSPSAPTVTNEKGGKQSKTEYAFNLIDDGALLALAETLQKGAEKYERDNWRKIPPEEHFNHMLIHYYAWRLGDHSDDHLAHMFCRAMMLYATARDGDAG